MTTGTAQEYAILRSMIGAEGWEEGWKASIREPK
jgi:hypothetical protein